MQVFTQHIDYTQPILTTQLLGTDVGIHLISDLKGFSVVVFISII